MDKDKNETSGTANHQIKCTGCPQSSPKGFTCHYFITKGRSFANTYCDKLYKGASSNDTKYGKQNGYTCLL